MSHVLIWLQVQQAFACIMVMTTFHTHTVHVNFYDVYMHAYMNLHAWRPKS